MCFKIDWASLIAGSKFTVFALFYFVFEGNFPNTSPRGGGLYLEGRFNGGFLLYRFGGIIFGGAYTWRDLFSEFYGILFYTLKLYIPWFWDWFYTLWGRNWFIIHYLNSIGFFAFCSINNSLISYDFLSFLRSDLFQGGKMSPRKSVV